MNCWWKYYRFFPPKVSVSTSVLSKRWRNLCIWVTNLEFDDSQTKPSACHLLRLFILRNLRIHRPLIIKSLGFKLSADQFRTDNITRWVGIAVSRGICELRISYSFRENHPTTLPTNLYTSKSLATMKLHDQYPRGCSSYGLSSISETFASSTCNIYTQMTILFNSFYPIPLFLKIWFSKNLIIITTWRWFLNFQVAPLPLISPHSYQMNLAN